MEKFIITDEMLNNCDTKTKEELLKNKSKTENNINGLLELLGNLKLNLKQRYIKAPENEFNEVFKKISNLHLAHIAQYGGKKLAENERKTIETRFVDELMQITSELDKYL